MIRKATLILAGFFGANLTLFAQTHSMTIVLDTKKFPNINCSLNANGTGGPSPLTDVYMHAGVCWQDPANPSSAVAAELFCIQQIIPLNSEVWQSVVGNWGSTPQADGVGQMTNMGNGVFQKSFVLEQYFSSPDVSTATEPVSGVTSQPMPAGETAYTMGLVFRDPTGAITGRDSLCSDIFIWKLTTTPEVIQSLAVGVPPEAWPNGPVSFTYQQTGIDEPELWYDQQLWPNPAANEVNIRFFVRNNQENFELHVYDALGNKVRTIHQGYLPAGKQHARWDLKDDHGYPVAAGMYSFTLVSGNNMVSDRFIVTNR